MKEILLLDRCVERWANEKGHAPALVFMDDGEQVTATLSFSTLHQRAQHIAAHLQRKGLTSERVLLLLPSGIEYVLGFAACLYAGAIAVPLYPPRNNWHARRTIAVATNAGAKCILTSARLLADVSSRLAEVKITVPDIVAVDELDDSCGAFINTNITPQDVAYLQYTSGSTGEPKGVMVRHADLLTNCALYSAAVGVEGGKTFVSWLPIFHDMGLVQGIVMPLTLGGTAVFMPPTAFIQKPIRWLRAIDRHRAVFSGGPNFAYDLCVRKTSDQEASTLDLSAWRIAINGAEPISHDTLHAFADKFQVSGFREEALVGAYGMAEATLVVSTTKPGQCAPVIYVDKTGLEQDRIEPRQHGDAQALPIVSCGVLLAGFDTRIVDPQSECECEAGRVGEIWISGGSIAAGYWDRPKETEETFGATLDAVPGTRFLRTGDLGFMSDGHLYITGRLKDLIIIRGANHYPQDIEKVAGTVDPALRRGGWGAAFTVEQDGASHLVLVQEVERSARRRVDADDIGRRIARTVNESNGIDIDVVVLVDPGSIPKTSSGKIQRQECRRLFLAGELREVGRWERPAVTRRHESVKRPQGERELTSWLCDVVADLGGLPLAQVSPDEPFSAYGLDSVRIVQFAGEVSEMLGLRLPPTIAFEYPTIAKLARYLSGSTAAAVVESGHYEPIAVIGMHCRFPGADGPDAYWRLLESGDVAVDSISEERRKLTGYQAEDGDPFQWGGFLSGIEYFDASLFGISPREAESIDPQQRILLETTWAALESANIAPDALTGSSTGVFIGISANDYFCLRSKATYTWDAYAATGGALSIAANRISYCLGLQGPSMAIDTACSSSLVTVHEASRSLGDGETHLAIAGGVNLVLSADYGAILTQAQMLSPSGRCRTFDDEANGYVRGEGCGVVVLKRLKDALRDGDRVLAVIRGSAVNQDGFSNGLTAPNGLAQQRVIRNALRRAGFPGATIGYVETHGTGTPLGDPIEVRSLRAVLDDVDGASSLCWLGAAKTNIGHLESAAGIAGLIKAILVLHHGVIPANRNFQTLNRHIDLADSRLRLPTANTVWPDVVSYPRRAGVSSFGFGGTNAHVVLEAFRPAMSAPNEVSATEPTNDGGVALLVLAAKSEASLAALARDYAVRLEQLRSEGELAALCRTASMARARLPERLAVTGTEAAAMAQALRTFVRTRKADAQSGLVRGRARPRPTIAFPFTGQGSQYAGMGAELDRSEPVFRDYLSRCNEILRAPLGASLYDILFGEQTVLLDSTRYAQPALVALELALAELWRHWGVEAEFVAGHSIGEYAAACVAGILDVETTLRIVAERGRLMASAPGQGAMASVRATLDVVNRFLAEVEDIEVAAINAPEQVVISGGVSAVEAAIAALRDRNIEAARLNVSHGFHSRLMEPILPEFRSVFDGVAFGEPARQMVPAARDSASAVTSSSYWVNQLRLPVRFADVLADLQTRGVDAFIEIGPSPVLIGLGRRAGIKGALLSSLQAGQDGGATTRASLGALFTLGAPINFKRLDENRSPSFSEAPLYPFDRVRYWFTGEVPIAHGASLPYIGRRIDVALSDIACFEATPPHASEEFLLDHRVCGRSIMPGAGYVSIMLAAARHSSIEVDAGIVLRDLRFSRPLDITDRTARMQTVLRQVDGAASWRVEISAGGAAGRKWETCAAAVLEPATLAAPTAVQTPSVETGESIDTTQLYEQFAAWGLEYGPAFRGCRKLTRATKHVRADIAIPTNAAPIEGSPVLHPALLDAAFQTLGALLAKPPSAGDKVPLPVGIQELVVYGPGTGIVRVECSLRDGGQEGSASGDITLRDAHGRLVAAIRELQIAWVDASAIHGKHDVQILRTAWHQHPAREQPADLGRWMLWAESGRPDDAVVERMTRQGLTAIRFDDIVGLAEATIGNMPSQQPRGALLILDREQTDVDPITRCQQLCENMQRFLLALDRSPSLLGDFSVWIVTRAAARQHSTEIVSVAQAGVAGMWRSAALELPGLRLRHADLPAAPTDLDIAALASVLVDVSEFSVVVRDGICHVPRLQQAEKADSDGSPPLQIRADATYLITGGTGSIGPFVAEWLAGSGARHIVLVGRRAQLAASRARVDALRAAGVDVVVRRADVSQRTDAENLVRELSGCPHPLRGIIHAAGVVDDRALSAIDSVSWECVMAAKARSAQCLLECTRGCQLDFFVGFSSIAATLGSAGQCNYAAANALLDALAATYRAGDRTVMTLNWGPWAEAGMASEPGVAERLSRQGLYPMPPVAALDAMSKVFNMALDQTLIVAADWSRYQRNLPLPALSALLREISAADASVPASAPVGLISAAELLALPQAEAEREILLALGQLLGAVLRVDARGQFADRERLANVPLLSLGIDSLTAMELRNSVQAWLGADLPPHVLISSNGVAEVAELIYEKILLRSVSVSAVDRAEETSQESEVFVL